MYFYCKSLCIIIVVYVFLLILCILIVRPCILNVVYVFLLWSMYSQCLSMYSYCCLCILIVIYVFLDAATLTEVFSYFFLGCKANARVILAKTGHGPHSYKIVVLLYVQLFCILCIVVCKCVLPPGDNPIAVNKYIISYIKPSDKNVLNVVVSPGGAGHLVRVVGCTPAVT